MNLRVKCVFSIVLLGLLCLILPGPIRADTVNINSINANSSPFFVDITTTNLLAQYGITLANVTPGTTVGVLCGDCGGNSIVSSSPPNTLTQFGNDNGMSYTLQFSTPLSTLSFTLAGNSKSGGSGTVVAAWSATAFDASGNVVSSAGDPSLFGTFSPFPPQPFTLSGPGIASVTFFTQCFNFCGTGFNIADLSAPEIKLSVASGCQVNIQRWGQCDGKPGPWGGDIYAFHYLTNRASVCAFGCALTSLAMDLKWASVSQIPDYSLLNVSHGPVALDPHSLNLLMTRGQSCSASPCLFFDYSPSSDVQPDITARDISVLTRPVPLAPIYFSNAFQGNTDDLDALDQAVCHGGKGGTPQPVIVGVTSQCSGTFPGHYVLVTGEVVDPVNGRRFTIADPAGSGTCGKTGLPIKTCSFLDCYAGVSANFGVANDFVIWGSVTDPAGDVSGLDLQVGNAANILISDGNGRQTGFDPVSGSILKEIPGSSYFSGSTDNEETGDPGPQFHSIQIFQPATGNYNVAVSGLVAGTFEMDVAPYSQDGSPQPRFSLVGIATTNSTSVFAITYNSAPGSSSNVTRVATFQSTLSDIANSAQFGLIDDQGIANALSSKIAAASSAAASGDTDTAKNVLGAFLNQLNAQNGKHINGIALQVLREDAASLIAQVR